MEGKERLIKRIRVSKSKFQLLMRCFLSDVNATQTSQIYLLNRNTINRYFNFFRDLVVQDQNEARANANIYNGIEVDESYFGARRQRGKRGRGASNKIIVFGLLKRQGRVYTEIISNARRDEIMPIIRKVVKSGADIYSDGWRSYDALAVYGYNHKKVNHEKDEFTSGDKHINGIESFWSWTKHRLQKFHGVKKELFKRYLLESEWRFNHRNDKIKRLRFLIRKYKYF